MSESVLHPNAHTLADYHTGRLPAPEVLAVSDHLAGCPACRRLLAAELSSPRQPELPAILADAPPDYEEMAALLDGTLDAAQSADVRARLAASPHAAAEFADLRAFHEAMAGLPLKLHGPGAADTAFLPEVLPAPGKIVAFPRARWRSLAAAAAAVALLAAGWWTVGVRSTRSTGPLWADADLSSLPAELRQGVEQAARTGRIAPPPLLAELRPPAGTLAGEAAAPARFHQEAPVGVVVRETKPALRWTACDGATGYVVYLVDTEGRAPMVRQELPGGQTAWTPPAPLTRGAVYEWQVEARRGSEIIDRAARPPAPESRFQVLDEAHAAGLAQVEGRYGQNPLVLGTAYALAGLDAAAAGQFTELKRKYPRSAAARRLLEETQGRTQKVGDVSIVN